MSVPGRGALRVFRLAGIDVYVHWSWLLVAAIEIKGRSGRFSSLLWNLLEYLTLVTVVLLHEFGHALACKQVRGKADKILLWPLGGVAFVTPPARPGATLWSIAAGPLVNALLLGLGALLLAVLPGGTSDPRRFLVSFTFINLGLLLFNTLPVYPLDGGQILRALLWFVFGRATSLLIVAGLGLVTVAVLLGVAMAKGSLWLGFVGLFALVSCWRGVGRARVLARLSRLQRREGFICPACKSAPPVADLWACSHCRLVFDTFATNARCPGCGLVFEDTGCPDCGQAHPIGQWLDGAATPKPTAAVLNP